MKTQKNNASSLAAMIGAMLIFGTIGIFRRMLPLPSSVIACCRGALGAILLTVFVKLRGRRIFHGIGLKKTALLALSGAMIGFNWILLFEAYNYTTVAVATLCYYMAPIIVILLSPIIFRERLTLKKGLCAAAAIVGMVFVAGIPGNGLPGAGEAKGIILGLGAAALYAAVVILNKKLPKIDAYEKTVIQLGSAAIVLVPYILLTEDVSAVSLDAKTALLLAFVGIVNTGVAYTLYFGSLDGLRAQTAAIVSFLDPVAALILAAVFLREPMTAAAAAGAVLVLGAAAVSEIEFPVRKQ